MAPSRQPNIPIELLRRSARRMIKKESDQMKIEENVTKRVIKRGFEGQIREPKRSKLAKPQDFKREHVDLASSKHLDPHGILDIDCCELDLERTLLGGQSFRWTKLDLPDGCATIFTGIIFDLVLQLWRVSPHQIAFKCLNSETTGSQAIHDILQDYFQLGYKLKDLYEQWSLKDKHLAESCKELKGFRILRQDPVENLFSFICATNNNIKRISLMVDNLCRKFGPILEVEDRLRSERNFYHSFPTAERLAEADVFDCLRYELGFGYRAKYITETAKQLIELGEKESMKPKDYLLSLRNLPYRDTCKKLIQFQGIGRKVADCICLMSMDHLESVPIDCHIYEIVCRHYMPNLRKERKSLTEGVHDLIGDYFKTLHGPLAGWSTSVLFIGELRHLRTSTEPTIKRKEKQQAANRNARQK